MRKMVLIALMAVGIMSSVSAQHDDLYFVPKKKKVLATQVEEKLVVDAQSSMSKTYAVTSMPAKQLEMDEDAYNRRGSYLIDEDNTMSLDEDSLNFARVDEGWVNGFEGSDSDYEYAMRIIRFRNPRYAIPVSSPLYWDVVYGGSLWPSWEWNVYDDGMYAYVVPTSNNWYYGDYYMNYPWGWSTWGNHWHAHHGYHWGVHWGNHYYGWQICGHLSYDPWYSPGWHHGHHHGHYPGVSRPGWGGGPKVIQNNRTPGALPSRRGTQVSNAPSRVNSSARVVAGRTGSTGTSVSRPSGTAVRSSGSSHTNSNEVVRRSTSSSSVSRSSSSSRSSSGYSSRGSSGSSGSSYSRPSSTRSSSSSTSRSSSSSSSTSSRSSYSSGSSSRSSYNSGGSYGGSSSRSSSSYGGSSSRGSSSYGGGSSRSSGSRR